MSREIAAGTEHSVVEHSVVEHSIVEHSAWQGWFEIQDQILAA
ncbi:hypothetical protein [Glutamicibacter sp.]